MPRLQVLGTPSREDIQSMNPNYTEFQFPQIKAHPWSKVFSKRLPPDAIDLVRARLGKITVVVLLFSSTNPAPARPP